MRFEFLDQPGAVWSVDVDRDGLRALSSDKSGQVDPERKFERGLNSLGAISVANGFGEKEMDGATAPRSWAQGRHAEVIEYCYNDVLKTQRLFEKIVLDGAIMRGDGQPIQLVPPTLAMREQVKGPA